MQFLNHKKSDSGNLYAVVCMYYARLFIPVSVHVWWSVVVAWKPCRKECL